MIIIAKVGNCQIEYKKIAERINKSNVTGNVR